MNKAGNYKHFCANAVQVMDRLRVAAVQLPRLDPEDRAVLLPYVKRDMERANG